MFSSMNGEVVFDFVCLPPFVVRGDKTLHQRDPINRACTEYITFKKKYTNTEVYERLLVES